MVKLRLQPLRLLTWHGKLHEQIPSLDKNSNGSNLIFEKEQILLQQNVQ